MTGTYPWIRLILATDRGKIPGTELLTLLDNLQSTSLLQMLGTNTFLYFQHLKVNYCDEDRFCFLPNCDIYSLTCHANCVKS